MLAVTLVFAAGAVALAGCGLSDGIGALMVDPAQYQAYRCKDLATAAHALAKRETRLRNLIDKARQGRGGTVIGAMAYGDTYDATLEKEKLVRRAAAQKKCRLAPPTGATAPSAEGEAPGRPRLRTPPLKPRPAP